MLSHLNITGYRGFSQVAIPGLTRVNVFVGANNAGKTAALEAIELLSDEDALASLQRVLTRRDEYSFGREPLRQAGPLRVSFDHQGIFHGRSPKLGDALVIQDETRRYTASVERVELLDESGIAQEWLVNDERAPTLAHAESLRLRIERKGEQRSFPLHLPHRLLGGSELASSRHVSYLGTSMPAPRELATMWDEIALTEREDQVIAALNLIEPEVRRVAFLGSSQSQPDIYVQLSKRAPRIPLGSMGEGIRRLLALSLTIGTTAPGGCLLIDEVDTGLHYTVLRQVWQLLIRAAHSFDLQLFATTHSLDCLMALASVTRDEPEVLDQAVSGHRFNPGGQITRYGGDELRVAIAHELEVR